MCIESSHSKWWIFPYVMSTCTRLCQRVPYRSPFPAGTSLACPRLRHLIAPNTVALLARGGGRVGALAFPEPRITKWLQDRLRFMNSLLTVDSTHEGWWFSTAMFAQQRVDLVAKQLPILGDHPCRDPAGSWGLLDILKCIWVYPQERWARKWYGSWKHSMLLMSPPNPCVSLQLHANVV